jgi:D-glycero-D-manno-heptose 1,7-bisphosphate phosphatase
LKHAGYQIAIATNQSGIGRGYFDSKALHDMHAKLGQLLAAYNTQIDAIYHCPHLPDAGCACRKPQPGMLLQALEAFSQPAADTWMVGDSYKDVQAAIAAGCKPMVVRTGNGQDTIKRLSATIPVFENLQAVAAFLCETAISH